MHADKRKRRITETGTKDKCAVVGIMERGGEVRGAVVGNRRKHALQSNIRAHVAAGSAIYTDALMFYQGLKEQGFEHEVIDHAEGYVRGQVHTNGLENFWSLFKRALKGTYVSTEEFHLFRYLDEQMFRFNSANCLMMAQDSSTLRITFSESACLCRIDWQGRCSDA